MTGEAGISLKDLLDLCSASREAGKADFAQTKLVLFMEVHSGRCRIARELDAASATLS